MIAIPNIGVRSVWTYEKRGLAPSSDQRPIVPSLAVANRFPSRIFRWTTV